MITINDTPLSDNLLIFVMRIYLDDGTLRYATREITLSTNVYSADVLFRVDFTTLSSISKDIYIANGGGVGSLSAMEFSLSNFSGKYIDEFYPSTSKPYLTSRKVDVGFLWSGATTEAEITWINSYYINSVTVEPNRISCLCIELSDLENKELPYYEVQKEFDNKMSYFPTAPEDSYDLPIPILYGDFAVGVWESSDIEVKTPRLMPLVCVNKATTRYMCCSHPVHTAVSDVALADYKEIVWLYLDDVESYMFVSNEDSANSSTVNDVRHILNLKDRAGKLLGTLIVKLTDLSDLSDIDDIQNVIDEDLDTYNEINAGEKIALRSLGSLDTSSVGFLGFASTDIGVFFRSSSDSANNRGFKVYYSNPNVVTPAGTNTTGTISGTTSGTVTRHFFGASTTAKIDSSLPWRIDEILSMDYVLENTQGTAGEKIRVYNAYLYFFNIIVYNPYNPRATRNTMGLRNNG